MKQQNGFTIIELMIATSVFAIILLITTISILFATKIYVKGDVISSTQDAANSIITTVSQDISYSNPNSISLSNIVNYNGHSYTYYCIGNHVYVFTLDQEIQGNFTGPYSPTGQYTPHALLVFNQACPLVTSPTATKDVSDLGNSNLSAQLGVFGGVSELLTQNLRLGQFSVTRSNVNSADYIISITVGYGNDDVLSSANGSEGSQDNGPYSNYEYSCDPINLGGQFCAVSTLTTTVSSRIQ